MYLNFTLCFHNGLEMCSLTHEVFYQVKNHLLQFHVCWKSFNRRISENRYAGFSICKKLWDGSELRTLGSFASLLPQEL